MDKNDGAAPAADDTDSALYAAMEKELGGDDEGPVTEPVAEPEAKAEPAPKDEPKAKEPEKPAEKDPAKAAPLPYEELEKRHKDIQGALTQERGTRKQLAAENAELKAFLQRFVEQRQAPQQPQAQTQPVAPQIPDINEDPIGHFNAKMQALEAKLAATEQQAGETRAQYQARVEEERFWGNVREDESRFMAQTPDYGDAVQHYQAARMAELQFLLPDDSPAAEQTAATAGYRTVADLRMALLKQDFTSVSRFAMQHQISPAERMYQIAKLRGYQPKAAKPAVPTQTQIASTKAGAAAAKSMSAGGGGGQEDDMSMSALSELYMTDPDRADKVYEQMKKKGLL